jgi:hypothetical protein
MPSALLFQRKVHTDLVTWYALTDLSSDFLFMKANKHFWRLLGFTKNGNYTSVILLQSYISFLDSHCNLV